MKADIYLILALLLIVISLAMAVFNLKANRNILYLSSFLVILGLEGTLSWFFHAEHSNARIFAFFFNHTAPLYSLKAPLLYFFVRGNIRDDYRLSAVDFLHFIPALIHLILIVPYALLPFNEKVDIVAFILENRHLYVHTDLYYPYPHIWNQYFRSVQLVVYAAFSIVIMLRFRKQTTELPANLRSVYQSSSNWIFLLLASFVIVGLLQLTMVIQPATGNSPMQAMHTVSDMYRYALIVYVLIPVILLANPKLLYGFPSFRLPAVKKPGYFLTEYETEIPSGSSYSERISVNMDTLFTDIKKLLDIRQLYLDPELKVSDISELLHVPAYQIVLCLSIKAEKPIDVFLNEFRVKHAISLVKKNPENQSPEILGAQSGFRSVVEFERVFRKFTGFSFRAWYEMTITKRKTL